MTVPTASTTKTHKQQKQRNANNSGATLPTARKKQQHNAANNYKKRSAMPPLPKITTKAAGAADLLSCSTKLRRSPRAAESQLHWLIVAFPLLSNATTQHPDNALQVDCCFHVFFGSHIFFRPKSCANYRQQCHRDCRGKIVAPHRMTHCRGELFFFQPPPHRTH